MKRDKWKLASSLFCMSFAVASCARQASKEEGWKVVGSLDNLIHFVEADPRIMTSAAQYRHAVDVLCDSKQCVQVAFFLPGDVVPPSGPRRDFFQRGGWKLYHPAAVFMGEDFTRWDCERLNFKDAPSSALCGTQTAISKAARSRIDSPTPVRSPTSKHVPRGSERHSILDALRPAVESRVGSPIEFVVDTILVDDGWAFVVANPQRKAGAPIDGRAVFGDDFDSLDGLRVDAVLRHQDNGWTLVQDSIGATDVWYCDVGPRGLKEGHGC